LKSPVPNKAPGYFAEDRLTNNQIRADRFGPQGKPLSTAGGPISESNWGGVPGSESVSDQVLNFLFNRFQQLGALPPDRAVVPFGGPVQIQNRTIFFQLVGGG